MDRGFRLRLSIDKILVLIDEADKNSINGLVFELIISCELLGFHTKNFRDTASAICTALATQRPDSRVDFDRPVDIFGWGRSLVPDPLTVSQPAPHFSQIPAGQ